MKRIQRIILSMAAISSSLFLVSCEESMSEKLGGEAKIENMFTVTGVDGKVYKGVIGESDVKIKVSPYLDAATVLKDAKASFCISKGATVTPDPSEPQDFAQEGGVKYTVVSEDKKNVHEYTVTWAESDKLPAGEGFSYAEKGAKKSFVELGYPGEVGNYGLPSIQYGDLQMYIAYCGNNIVLLSRGYLAAGNADLGIKVVDKDNLEEAGKLNLGSLKASDIRMISSDYKGHCVAVVIAEGSSESEVWYWTSTSEAPKSAGKIGISLMASTNDLCSNFQVSGDITTKAWLTALAPRSPKGEHYRVKVSEGKLSSEYSTITTGYSSSDCTGFQMISALDDSDEPNYVVGDTEGTANAANSVHCYVNNFGGSTLNVMPKLWQNTLQSWWVGTGFALSRMGGRCPVVMAMPINGKPYVFVTSGTSWWHSGAVLTSDLQTLAHANLNIAHSVNRAWSFGAWADWYWDEDKQEAYLAMWMGRYGMYTYKLTCFE